MSDTDINIKESFKEANNDSGNDTGNDTGKDFPLTESRVLKVVRPFMAENISLNEDAYIDDLDRVMTTDMLIEGTHFDWQYSTPYDVGWKAASVNLSDLNGMLARPLQLTVGLGIPKHTLQKDLHDFYQGLSDACNAAMKPWRQEASSFIVGGDTVRAPQWSVSITAIGQRVNVPKLWGLRSSAQVGHRVILSGEPGLSATGLWALQNGLDGYEAAKTQHRRPALRSDAMKNLLELSSLLDEHKQPKNDDAPSSVDSVNSVKNTLALMDTSDGLADAALKIAGASSNASAAAGSGFGAHSISIVLNERQLPCHPDVHDVKSANNPRDMMLYGGEDFGLLACIPSEYPVPEGFVEIGTVVERKADSFGSSDFSGLAYLQVTNESESGEESVKYIPLSAEKTFQHFGDVSGERV